MFLKPLITEKTMEKVEKFNEYTFVVLPYLTKTIIKKIVEENFGVKVLSVKTKSTHGKIKKSGKRSKPSKRSDMKNAVVKLAKDNKIGLFEGKEKK